MEMIWGERRKSVRFGGVFLATALVAASAASVGTGQTFNLTAGTNSWNTAANWTPSGVPNAIGASTTFNSPTGNHTVNLNAGITVGTISFTNDSSSIFTLANGTSGSLTMNGGGTSAINIVGTSTTTNNVTISASTTLSDALSVDVANAFVSGSAAATFTGAISGSGSFTKTGAGRLSFTTAAKTYSGATNIQQGRLRLTSSGSITGTSGIAVSSGGMLMLDSAATWNLGSGTISLAGNGTGEVTQGVGALRTQTSGANTISNAMSLASDATIHIDGGASVTTFNGSFSGNFELTKSGGGNITMNGANAGWAGSTKLLNGSITVGSASRLASGDLTFAQTSGNNTTVTPNNSTQTIGNLSTEWVNTSGTHNQTLVLNGTALTINQTANTDFGNGLVGTLQGRIQGSGSVIKDGVGTLTLTGANTYTGNTTVKDGTLKLSALGSIDSSANASSKLDVQGGMFEVETGRSAKFGASGASTVSGTGELKVNGTFESGSLAVSDSGVVSGAGTIKANTTIAAGATLSPGNSIDTITINGDLTLLGTYDWELDNVLQSADLTSVSGNLDLTGATLNFSEIGSAMIGDKYTLFAYDGTVTGAFSNSISKWVINYADGTAGLNGGVGANFVTITAIPEPSSIALISLISAGSAAFARRRRKQSK